MSKELLKKKFESGNVVITRKNIHLFYEYMSDENLSDYAYLFSETLKIRLGTINDLIFSSLLNDDLSNPKEAYTTKKQVMDRYIVIAHPKKTDKFVTKISAFGINDTLKPIAAYISDIKASDEYKHALGIAS